MSAEVKGERTNAVLPITLGINAFRGFLDEFMKTQEMRRKVKKVENKPVKRDKHKKDAIIVSKVEVFVKTLYTDFILIFYP